MSFETIVAVFDTPAHAQAAIAALKAGGFHDADISIVDAARLTASNLTLDQVGLWQRFFGNGLHQHEAEVYTNTIKNGGAVLSARVLNSEVAHAVAILDIHRPVDVQDRAVTTGIAPAAHVEAVAQKIAAMPLAAEQQVAVSPKLAELHDEVLRLAEEQLQVGKQMLETGRTRVRRFVTEREVAADVNLHEEHAEVMRRAIVEPAILGEIDWADKSIEVIETAEQAVVNKTARIVEELSVKKVGSDHVETVHDKVRRQQAEIERVGLDGKIIPAKVN